MHARCVFQAVVDNELFHGTIHQEGARAQAKRSDSYVFHLHQGTFLSLASAAVPAATAFQSLLHKSFSCSCQKLAATSCMSVPAAGK